MVWAAALALVLAADAPWQRDPIIDAPAHYFTTTDGNYWVYDREIKRDRGSVILWLHGEHSNAPRIPYRTSVWHVHLYCNDEFSVTAGTTWRADGSTLSNWDAIGTLSAIRPGSMYDSLQTAYCIK